MYCPYHCYCWNHMEFRYTYTGHRQSVESIFRIILARYRYLLDLLDSYGVPISVSYTLTQRIIGFTLNNAPFVEGSVSRRIDYLYRNFVRENGGIILLLGQYDLPEFVVMRFIREVIVITLVETDQLFGGIWSI